MYFQTNMKMITVNGQQYGILGVIGKGGSSKVGNTCSCGITKDDNYSLKGRFLEFRRYHSFANLFSKLLESIFHKRISKFQ